MGNLRKLFQSSYAKLVYFLLSYHSFIIKSFKKCYTYKLDRYQTIYAKTGGFAESIDKLYINGSGGSITIDGLLLARFKRVGDVSHFYKDTIPICNPLTLRLGRRISLFQCLKYEWAREFPYYTIFISISL